MKRIFVYLLAFTLVLPLASQPDNKTPQKPPKITRPTSKPKPTQKPQPKPTQKPQPKPTQKPQPRPRVSASWNSSSNTLTVNGVTYRMVYVSSGSFNMGATPEQKSPLDNEKPVHSVFLDSYYIGQTEVTQALWTAVMGTNPSYFTGDKGDNLPVENVSWNDCQTFITKLNQLTGEHFRLPTEAEWEFAARGGNKSKGYTYSGSNTLGNVAWYYENSGDETHEVATKQANELGIYDMSGNVEEWCQDWYGGYSSSAQTNPTGPSSGSDRVYRGGCWRSYAGDCRAAYRNYDYPDGPFDYPVYGGFALGLRLVLSE